MVFRNRRAGRSLGSALLPLLALASAQADGVLLPLSRDADEGRSARLSVPLRRAVIFRPNQGEVTLLLQPVYRGPVTEFCWLIPTPVLPRAKDVFVASQDFMDAVFRRTAPLVETEAPGAASWQPFLRPAPKGSPTLARSLWERDIGPGERLDVRWYESVMLPNGEGEDDVAQWLRANGYAVGDDLADICRQYVRRGWHFVALRILPASAGTGPVLKYLTPVGLHLKTQQAVYPLGIAAAGAPEHTVLQLAVIAPTPVECRELPVATIPRRTVLPAGRWYEEYRETLGAGGLAKEAEALGPQPFTDLSYWADHWADSTQYSWDRFWTTRLTGRLTKDRLVDLTFTSAKYVHPFRVHLYQRASEPRGSLGWLRTGPGRFLAVWVLVLTCGAVLWAGGQVAEQKAERSATGGQTPSPWHFLLRLPVYGGWMLLLSPAALAIQGALDQLLGPRLYLGGQLPAAPTRVWAVLLLVWAALALRLVIGEVRETGGGRLFAVLFTALSLPWLTTVVLSPSSSLRVAASLGDPAALVAARIGAIAAVLGFASVLSWALYTVIIGPRRFRWMAAEFAIVLLVFLAFSPLLYASGVGQHAPAGRTPASSPAETREAVARFRCQYQAFPKDLASLAGQVAPAEGLDMARNRVSIAPAAGYSAPLAALPTDPSTPMANWVYDPTMPVRVASAALSTRVDRARYDAAKPQPASRYWSAPSQGDLRTALGRVRRVIWGSGDALVRAGDAAGTGPLLSAVDVSSMSAACVLPGNVQRMRAVRISAPPVTGLLLASAQVRAADDLSGATDSPRSNGGHPRCALFSITGPVLRMEPMGSPIAGKVVAMEASPDGLRAACILSDELQSPEDRTLWVLDAAGVWLGPLACNVARVAWHPSGDYLLALVAEPDSTSSRTTPRCRLLRVDANGAAKSIRTQPRFLPDTLVASYGRAFVMDGAGDLLGIELATGEEQRYATLGGDVLDLLHLGAGKVAALVGSAVVDGARASGRLRFLDSSSPQYEASRRSRRSDDTDADAPRPIDRIAPEGVKWTDGRIIGAYGLSGYHFIHLWSEDNPVGVVVMVGENGAPPQEIPVTAAGGSDDGKVAG